MKAFIARLAQFFQDDTGALSAMRLLFIGWGIGTLVVWVVLSIKTATMIPLPWSITGFISSLTAGKVIQNFTENTPSGTVSGTIATGGAELPVTASTPPPSYIVTAPGSVVTQVQPGTVVNPVPQPTPAPEPVAVTVTVPTAQTPAQASTTVPTPVQTPPTASVAPAPVPAPAPLPPGTVAIP